MKIIRGELTPNSLTPPSTRYDATCNCIQVTTDGGATWQDAVGQDPRSQPAYLKPPVAGSNKACDSAANMVKWLHDFMDEIIAGLTAGAQAVFAANTLIAFLELCFPFAAYFIELVFEAAVDLLGVGAADLNAAFDSATYDLLLCIFMCNADSDGRISAAALTEIEVEIVAQLNTTAALIVNEILFITGEVGLSNVGAAGSETGDCTGCDCAWCFNDSLTADDGGFSADFGSWSAGWHEGNVDGAGCGGLATYTFLSMGRDLPAGDYTSFDITYTLTKGALCENNSVQIWDAAVGGTLIASAIVNSIPDGVNHLTWVGTMTNPSGIRVVISCGEQLGPSNPSGHVVATNIRYRGTGDNPFGTNNC